MHSAPLHAFPLTRPPSPAPAPRLCELNVMRQTFHVATSPTVQAAWSRGQDLKVYGCMYQLKDGSMKCLAGPINHDTDFSREEVRSGPGASAWYAGHL